MEEQPRVDEQKLVAVLKNGMIVFAVFREADLSIYCQNPFTDQIFTIERSLKIQYKKQPEVGALSSRDGKTISVLVTFDTKSEDSVLYRVGCGNGQITGNVHKETIVGVGDRIAVDNSSEGGVFHSNTYGDLSIVVFDLKSRVEKRVDLGGNLNFKCCRLHYLSDGFLCIAMYQRTSASFFNIGLGDSYLKLFDTKQSIIKPVYEIKIDGSIHSVAMSPNGKLLAIHKSKEFLYIRDGLFEENTEVSQLELWSIPLDKKLYTRDVVEECKLREVSPLELEIGPLSERRNKKDCHSGTLSIAINNRGTVAMALRYHGDDHLYFYSSEKKKLQHINMSGQGFEECMYQGNYKKFLAPSARSGYLTEDENYFVFPSTGKSWHVCKRDAATDQWVIIKRHHYEEKVAVEPVLRGHYSAKIPSAPPVTQPMPHITAYSAAPPAPVFQQPPLQRPEYTSSSLPSAPVMGTQTVQRISSLNSGPSFVPSAPMLNTQTLGRIERGNDLLSAVRKNSARISEILNAIEQKLDPILRQIETGRRPLAVVNVREVQFGKVIGRGGMGVVYHGMWRNRPIAIKTLIPAFQEEGNNNNEDDISVESKGKVDVLQKEYNILGALRHPNILEVLGCAIQEDGVFCVLMKYYPNRSLDTYLYSPHQWKNGAMWRLLCALEVSAGLSYLHGNNCLHLDIKPENVFVNEDWHVVLGDFGLSRLLEQNQTHQTTGVGAGTVAFTAPEIYDSTTPGQTTRYCRQNDIYSFAMLLWCCMAQKKPYEEKNHMQIMFFVAQGNREVIPENLPPRLAALIRGCWSKDVSARPTVEVVHQELSEFFSRQIEGGKKISFPKQRK